MGLRLTISFTLLSLIGILAFQNPDATYIHFFSDFSLPTPAFIAFVLITGIIIGKLLPLKSSFKHKPSQAEDRPSSSSNLFVGNLHRNIRKDDLKDTFSKYGTVRSVKIITDKHSGNPRGFGFVEMADEPGAKNAIKNLNGYELNGKPINVNAAHTRTNNQRNRNPRQRNYR